MFARQNGHQFLLELEDEPDEKNRLLEFYNKHLPLLMSVSRNVEHRIQRSIAVSLQVNKMYHYDWREFANEMGIIDRRELDYIQAAAESSNEQPIYLAMSAVINCHGFGKVIEALIKTKRYDILKDIEPDVKGLLQQSSSNDIKRLTSFEQSSLNFAPHTCIGSLPLPKKMKSAPSVMPLNCIKKDNHLGFLPVKLNTTLPFSSNCDYNTVQKSSMNIYSSGGIHSCNSEKPGEQLQDPVGELEKRDQIPTAPPEDSISVLIPHTDLESDVAVALQLSQKLREAGMLAKTLSELDALMLMNSTSALSTVFQDVDFIVPVVSSRYLQQIRPQNYEMYLESDYAMNNRHLYDLMMNEYRNNRCVNFRVRPVLVPEMNRRLLMTDVIMSLSLRLWNEVPKLINILKKTKEINPKSLVR